LDKPKKEDRVKTDARTQFTGVSCTELIVQLHNNDDTGSNYNSKTRLLALVIVSYASKRTKLLESADGNISSDSCVIVWI
jgi:hypothetical protein